MMNSTIAESLIDSGTLSFSIESRVLRELGERLVKQPEVAIVELIKNSYDADSTECTVEVISNGVVGVITVSDDGTGMTLSRFISGWMRIGTSIKEGLEFSEEYSRQITGEKGVGRFAVRVLGRKLFLKSVAYDRDREMRTTLKAHFDWPEFDKNADLGRVKVPYTLESCDESTPTGTNLVILQLRFAASQLNLDRIRTSSIDVLSPIASLLRGFEDRGDGLSSSSSTRSDPGFVLKISTSDESEELDIAAEILSHYTLQVRLSLVATRLTLAVYRSDQVEPFINIVDTLESDLGTVHADIRFFPRRKGAFSSLPVDGRRAYRWIATNSGVAVFDRRFRVSPYGMEFDDWLQLAADAARNRRDPRSSIAQKHFPMSDAERQETSDNWMLRLPQSAQLIGVVAVEGRRTAQLGADHDQGLIASADREGFVENKSFADLRDIIRGAVEAIAYVDRRIQQEEATLRQDKLLHQIRQEIQTAVQQIRENPNISKRDKDRLVATIISTEQYADDQQRASRERERQLNVMSLLGVVAGFMTHEFANALHQLESARTELIALAGRETQLKPAVKKFEGYISHLTEFSKYSSGYIEGSRGSPVEPYLAKPRISQVKRIFGRYAKERGVKVKMEVAPDLDAPLVPVSLYGGICLNLYTNALKSVTEAVGSRDGTILFQARIDRGWHYLEVSDTGMGIPSALRDRVFDPLFTTTSHVQGPLGSGMGLGLTLVRRVVEAFGGQAEVIDPRPGYSTTVQVRLPQKGETK